MRAPSSKPTPLQRAQQRQIQARERRQEAQDRLLSSRFRNLALLNLGVFFSAEEVCHWATHLGFGASAPSTGENVVLLASIAAPLLGYLSTGATHLWVAHAKRAEAKAERSLAQLAQAASG